MLLDAGKRMSKQVFSYFTLLVLVLELKRSKSLYFTGFNLQPYVDAKRSGTVYCDKCPKTFDNCYSYRAHVRAVHLNIRPHKCNFCDKAFPQLWKLKQHTRLVHTHKGEVGAFVFAFVRKVFGSVLSSGRLVLNFSVF